MESTHAWYLHHPALAWWLHGRGSGASLINDKWVRVPL
jgi:hypothetical protein